MYKRTENSIALNENGPRSLEFMNDWNVSEGMLVQSYLSSNYMHTHSKPVFLEIKSDQ